MLTYKYIKAKYGKTHRIKKVSPPNWDGTVNIDLLKKRQSVCAGGDDYYWLLTEKGNLRMAISAIFIWLMISVFDKPKFIEDDYEKEAKKHADELLKEVGINKGNKPKRV